MMLTAPPAETLHNAKLHLEAFANSFQTLLLAEGVQLPMNTFRHRLSFNRGRFNCSLSRKLCKHRNFESSESSAVKTNAIVWKMYTAFGEQRKLPGCWSNRSNWSESQRWGMVQTYPIGSMGENSIETRFIVSECERQFMTFFLNTTE